MSECEKPNKIQIIFKDFVELILKITEIYRYAGKIDEALSILKSNVQIMDFEEIKGIDKAKFLIQYAKILQQSKFIKEFNYDNEIQLLNEAHDLAKSSNTKNLMADAIDLIGTCIYSTGILEGEYQKAIDFFNQALNLRLEINDTLGLCKSYFNLGLFNENLKISNEENKRKSFEYYKKGLKIALEENFKLEQAYFYRHLAFFYQYFEDDKEKSLEYHLNSARIREEIGFKFSLQFAYFAVAMEYFYLEDFKNSAFYFKKAYFWAVKMDRVEQHKVIIFRRGNEMKRKDEVEKVMKYYELVLDSANEVKDLEGIQAIKHEIENLSIN